MSSLSLRTRRESERAVVTVNGELDLATVPSLREAALAELSAPDCSVLVLDLKGLSFLDSTGLGCWVELVNRAEETGKSLELVAVPVSARRTVAIAGLTQLFGLGDEDAPRV